MENTNEEKIESPVNEDAELDKSLEESISALKVGKELPPKEEAKPEEPVKETKAEDTNTPPVDEAKKEDAYDFRVPNKGKFESDESYEKRIELMDLVKRKKLAKTDEQRQQISVDIEKAKSQMKNLNGTDKITNPLNQKSGVEAEKKVEVEDEALKADKERLKQLGGATKEEVQEILQNERKAIEVKSTLEKFVDRHTELKDEDTREVFFDFVDSNYNWQNKSGRELMTVLELARESMFKPQESISERVLAGANVQEKVNAMQFPGGTVITKAAMSPEVKQSVSELMATGMSEAKALELLSD
jgi:hypothetical protein